MMEEPVKDTIKSFCNLESEKFIALIAGIVASFIIIGISTDESQDTINARNGLEECIIKDGYASARNGKLEPKTIWVKDCIKTQQSYKDVK